MKRRIGWVAVLIGSIIGATMAGPVAAGDLRIGGTGAVTDVLRALAPDFTAQSGIALVVMPSLGSSGANNAVADGAARPRRFRTRPARQRRRRAGLQARRRPAHALRPGDVTPGSGRPAERRHRRPSTSRPGRCWPDGMPDADRAAAEPTRATTTSWLRCSPGWPRALAAAAQARATCSVAATDQDNADHGRAHGGLPDRRDPDPDHDGETQSQRSVALDGVDAEPGSQFRERALSATARLLYLVAPRDDPAPEAEALPRSFLAGRRRPSSCRGLPRPCRHGSLVPGDCVAHKAYARWSAQSDCALRCPSRLRFPLASCRPDISRSPMRRCTTTSPSRRSLKANRLAKYIYANQRALAVPDATA